MTSSQEKQFLPRILHYRWLLLPTLTI